MLDVIKPAIRDDNETRVYAELSNYLFLHFMLCYFRHQNRHRHLVLIAMKQKKDHFKMGIPRQTKKLETSVPSILMKFEVRTVATFSVTHMNGLVSS